jgi:RNA polymerase primary sigma factor
MRGGATGRTFDYMNEDTLQAYLQEIGRYPLLTRAEEVQLAKRVEAGDESARKRMTEANLRLVVTIAKTYQRPGADLLDLIQEGTVGLMRAVDRYDWRRDVKFSTYAAWWIRHGITQALATARPIRVPDSILERANDVRAAERELCARLGREPSTSEVAAALDLTTSQVDEARAALQPCSSLEEPLRSEDTQRIDMLADPNATDPVESVTEEPREQLLRERLALLSDRGRKVIELRFGLRDGIVQTADAVAAELGVTRERVRQIELHALGKLAKAA